MADRLFVVMRRYGRPYDPGKQLEEQPDWEGHRAFMNALEAQGLVRLGGPLEGGGDVLLIVRANSAHAIEQQLAGDPWTASGLLTTTRIARWELRIGAVG